MLTDQALMDQANIKKILIAEDDKEYLWLLKENFNKHSGISIICAEDGEEGLYMAEKEKPDLIIIDISLPKIDGITMAKKIKEKDIASQIIFLTNFKDQEHISQAVEATGEAGYIIKSDMSIDDIVLKVKDNLGIK